MHGNFPHWNWRNTSAKSLAPTPVLAKVLESSCKPVMDRISKDLVPLRSLETLYDGNLHISHPDLISRYDAKQYLGKMRLHETARDYYYPFDVGATATVIDAIVGTKELMFAMGAGVFLLWRLSRRRRENQQQAQLQTNRDHLNRLVDETLEIERTSMDVTDPAELEKLLVEVTEIKLRALDELTDDEVRGDRMFSIFLLQCANLINKVQLRLMRYAQDAPDKAVMRPE